MNNDEEKLNQLYGNLMTKNKKHSTSAKNLKSTKNGKPTYNDMDDFYSQSIDISELSNYEENIYSNEKHSEVEKKKKLSFKDMLKTSLTKPISSINYLTYAFLSDQFMDSIDKKPTGSYFITPELQNAIMYGMTRSGKGQIIVNTMIELNSRAKNPFSFVVTDPKTQLSAMSYDTLRTRGFNVQVLNLQNMSNSMAYNPLELIIMLARRIDIGNSSVEAQELSDMIYDVAEHRDGDNAFFYTTAGALLSGLIFAFIAIAHGAYYGDVEPELNFLNDPDKTIWDKISLFNINDLVEKYADTTLDNNNDSKLKIDIFFRHLGIIRDKLASKARTQRLNDIEQTQYQYISQAVKFYSSINFAGAGRGSSLGSIYSQFAITLNTYNQQSVAKMTSMTNFNALKLGFDRILTLQFNKRFLNQHIDLSFIKSEISTKQNKRVIIPSKAVIYDVSSVLDESGNLTLPIDKKIEGQSFFIKATIHDERTEKDFNWLLFASREYFNITNYTELQKNPETRSQVSDLDIVTDENGREHVVDHYTRKPRLKNINLKIASKPDASSFSEAMIGKSVLNDLTDEKNLPLFIDQSEFMYDERPVALFLVTPPDRQSVNQLATFYIHQSFQYMTGVTLARSKNRKLQRPLYYIVDEEGNIPAIPELVNKVSIGAEQLTFFLHVFQSYEQLVTKQGKERASAIENNCALTYLILSKDKDTLKQVSDAVGKKTIITTDRTYKADESLTMSGNYNERKIGYAVIPEEQLKKLKPGEAVVLRTIDREDKTGKSIEVTPILNKGRYALPFSYTFLGKELKKNESLQDKPIVAPQKYFDPLSNIINWDEIYQNLEMNISLDKNYVNDFANRLRNDIDNSNNIDAVKRSLVLNVQKVLDDKSLQNEDKIKDLRYVQASLLHPTFSNIITNLNTINTVFQTTESAIQAQRQIGLPDINNLAENITPVIEKDNLSLLQNATNNNTTSNVQYVEQILDYITNNDINLSNELSLINDSFITYLIKSKLISNIGNGRVVIDAENTNTLLDYSDLLFNSDNPQGKFLNENADVKACFNTLLQVLSESVALDEDKIDKITDNVGLIFFLILAGTKGYKNPSINNEIDFSTFLAIVLKAFDAIEKCLENSDLISSIASVNLTNSDNLIDELKVIDRKYFK